MKRIITRHAQIQSSYDKHLYPSLDPKITELGREQATLLGKRLFEEGFCGLIVSSPYTRTLETAEIIAEITGCEILPFAPIREVMSLANSEFKGLSTEEIKKLFKHVKKEFKLEYPWWTSNPESTRDVLLRVVGGAAEIEKNYSDKDILYVGHGASVTALHTAYEIPIEYDIIPYNCAYSAMTIGLPMPEPVYLDTSHIAYEKVTSNRKTKEEIELEIFARPYADEISLPEGIEDIKGERVLHIGDTLSCDYPYYRELISRLKPDVIIHTGDLADEVKVGRIPTVKYEYISKIKRLSEILAGSRARLIICPGNNDLADEIKRLLPSAEIYPENSAVNISGVDCKIGHIVSNITFDKTWSFYGHGFRDDFWRARFNLQASPYRFNASHASYLCSPSENKFFILDKPHRF